VTKKAKHNSAVLKGVELFCGTKSFSKVAEKHGIDMFTIDFNPKFDPDLCTDVIYLTKRMIPKEYRNPDILWCSPPCETFSLSGNSMYMGFPTNPKTYIGLALAYKCVQMIQDLKPKWWFIENPMAGLRSQWFMQPLPRREVTYCQYGMKNMKPTDIFTNLTRWSPKLKCKNGDDCHESAPRSSGRGTSGEKSREVRGIIPEALCEEIVNEIIK
jgi:hypothetical protein